jgi:pimeloyl-ACP methyl ester carboxylesterase
VSTVRATAFSDRFNVAFSANGRYGVCVRAMNEDRALETWTFTGERASCQTVPEVGVDRETRALPLDDGRILLIQRDPASVSHRHDLTLLRPRGGGFSRHWLGELPARLGGYLLASPGADVLGLVVTLDGPEHSRIWRLSSSQITPIAQVPGLLTGGAWLDENVLALNQNSDSCRSSGIVVDVSQGSWRRIWSMSDTSIDRIVLADPRSKLFVTSTDAGGAERLGWGRLGEPTLHFPETLHRPGYVRRALTLDDRGERVLVHEVAGATSRLFVYTPADDRLEPALGPAGTVAPPASWAGELIRFRFSAPSRPPTLATLRLGDQPGWSWAEDDQSDSSPGSAPADLVELPGPGGPIEAIVYGGAGWRHSPHMVVALHGGPLSAWRFDFDPLFQRLAAAGVAVVAPNYRGSTGYGDDHLRAVIDDWGGPDLEDVLHLGRSLERERRGRALPRPVVLGASYGAFLALLAACDGPSLWSACVALAPFLSGPRLHEGAGATVQHRIIRLGGLRAIDREGPRDVLQVCESLSAPLLLVHGSRDLTIPVEHSRILRRRLLELGRTEGVDFEYLEVDGDHEAVVLARYEVLPDRVAHFCLTRVGAEGGENNDARQS